MEVANWNPVGDFGCVPFCYNQFFAFIEGRICKFGVVNKDDLMADETVVVEDAFKRVEIAWIDNFGRKFFQHLPPQCVNRILAVFDAAA